MSRRRYISTLISVDKNVRQLGDSAALFYTWLIPHCEDDATVTADFDELASIIVPNRKNWTTEKVGRIVVEIAGRGLFTERGGRLFLPPDSFYRFQSNIPVEKRRIEQPEVNPCSKPLQKKMLKVAENSTSPSPSPSPSPIKHMSNKLDGFDAWYKLYPRKVARAAAERAWAKAVKKVEAEKIVAGLEHQLSALKAKDKEYIPHPATWLNQERWDDEVCSPSVPQTATYVPFMPTSDDEVKRIEKLADFREVSDE